MTKATSTERGEWKGEKAVREIRRKLKASRETEGNRQNQKRSSTTAR